MDMTPLQQFIDESQAKCDAATGGPWEPVRSLTCGHLRAAHNYQGKNPTKEWTEDDMAFIAHARTALPAALQHLREVIEDRDKWMHSFKELERRHTAHCETSAKFIASMPQPPIVLDADTAELIKRNELLTRRVAELEGQVRCGWGGGPKP